jgi:DivIVA domain-containing protein
MTLTPEDVQAKTFKETRFKPGYDEDEVDTFLDEVEAELRRLLNDNSELRSRVRAAPPTEEGRQPPPVPPSEPVAPEPAPEPSAPAAPESAEDEQQAVARALVLAQRAADQAVAEAQAEADRIRSDAREQAESVRRDAEQQQAGRVAELTRQRGQLETTIEELRAFEREYRNRLKSYLESQLRELEVRRASPAGSAPASSAPRGANTGPVAGAESAAPQRPPAAATPAGGRSSSYDAGGPEDSAQETGDGHTPNRPAS